MLVMTFLFAASVGELTESYMKQLWKDSPTIASSVGYHKDHVDEKLDDPSPAFRKRRTAYLVGFKKKLEALDAKKLSADERADVRLLEENIALELFELQKAHDFSRRADLYMDNLGNVFF